MRKINTTLQFSFIVLLTMVTLSGCFEFPNQYSVIAPGVWRGSLELVPNFVSPNPKGEPLPEKLNLEFEEVLEGELPFNFEVVYDDETKFHLLIQNGEEKIKVDDIKIGRDIRTGSDTIRIDFPVFDSYITGAYEENVIQGKWVVNHRAKDNVPYEIPFTARYGQGHRFTTLKKEPIMDISGKWGTTFEINQDAPFPAIGEFVQKGNYVEGTFLTETGDYRYLQGTIQANKLYLSCFDGSHAFLFEAKINPDSTMIGSFRSGKHYTVVWEAQKNENAQLSDANKLTRLVEDSNTFNFNLENLEGEFISLDAPKYEGKAKIIQLFGTWCPNCKDETDFLLKYLKENPSEDLAVIGISFERYQGKEVAMDKIRTYKNHMKIPFEVLYGGYADKATISENFPMLNKFIAYPTLIFLDKENQVHKIHTGFSGPATSKYQEFVTDFNKTVKEIL